MKRTRGDLYGEDLTVLEGAELDDDDADQEFFPGDVNPSSAGEKKRRLGLEQVKALEKNFEVENKLDPERKLRIAHDLALQPRQVAVWFQNRRARWKTKQLERDYVALRSSYDSLAGDCDSLRRDKLSLLAEIKELKTKLGLREEEEECKEDSSADRPPAAAAAMKAYKDGSSDSDSSAVLFDENNSYQCGVPLLPELRRLPEELEEPAQGIVGGGFDFHLCSEWRPQRGFFPKVEQGFNAGEEISSSDFFSGEQHPIFSWYCSDHWS